MDSSLPPSSISPLNPPTSSNRFVIDTISLLSQLVNGCTLRCFACILQICLPRLRCSAISSLALCRLLVLLFLNRLLTLALPQE